MSEAFITDELFAALNTVVMERLEDYSFRLIGAVPSWFRQFYPDVDTQQDRLRPGEKFPFLDNFLVDAENFWTQNETGKIKSGLWVENDLLGADFYLEASAVSLQDRKVLLIASNYQEQQFIIQKARENSLTHENLLKEIQKKEILIHCIIHDLAGPLTGIKYCLELLSLQNVNSKAIEYIEIGKKQCYKQEVLIREILDAFSAEVESLDFKIDDNSQAPDALLCVTEVLKALAPAFFLNQINLQLLSKLDSSQQWKVVGKKLRLERVLSNLIENALRYSPPNSTVTIGLQAEEDFIKFTVDDLGSGIEPEIATTLFQKFSQGKNTPGKMGLGLYFCRITVESWGGSIGCTNIPAGGSRFWFRLPRVSN